MSLAQLALLFASGLVLLIGLVWLNIFDRRRRRTMTEAERQAAERFVRDESWW
jgi:hypothetical protein